SAFKQIGGAAQRMLDGAPPAFCKAFQSTGSRDQLFRQYLGDGSGQHEIAKRRTDGSREQGKKIVEQGHFGELARSQLLFVARIKSRILLNGRNLGVGIVFRLRHYRTPWISKNTPLHQVNTPYLSCV